MLDVKKLVIVANNFLCSPVYKREIKNYKQKSTVGEEQSDSALGEVFECMTSTIPASSCSLQTLCPQKGRKVPLMPTTLSFFHLAVLNSFVLLCII